MIIFEKITHNIDKQGEQALGDQESFDEPNH